MVFVEQILSFALPGRAEDYLRLFETEGLALLARLPGRLIGLYGCAAEGPGPIVELWAFDTAAEHDARAARLADDPACRTYLARALPLLVRREARLLTPAPFFRLPAQAPADLPP